MIYLDTSALAKLIIRESETATLGHWLRQRVTQLWVTSIIGRIELVRVARRLAAADGARLLLAGLDTIPLIEHVTDVAQTTGPATLRTLDAIHLASALSVRDELISFCCYDQRFLDAAVNAGLPVDAPGTREWATEMRRPTRSGVAEFDRGAVRLASDSSPVELGAGRAAVAEGRGGDNRPVTRTGLTCCVVVSAPGLNVDLAVTSAEVDGWSVTRFGDAVARLGGHG